MVRAMQLARGMRTCIAAIALSALALVGGCAAEYDYGYAYPGGYVAGYYGPDYVVRGPYYHGYYYPRGYYVRPYYRPYRHEWRAHEWHERGEWHPRM
jgi:hypothetical protein